MKKAVPLVILAAALAGAGWHFYGNYRRSHEPSVLHGNVDIRGVDLGFRVSGRIAEILVDEGDPVKAGDTLAKIDAEPYRSALEQARAAERQAAAAVSQAEGTLAQATAEADLRRAGYRTEEIDQARATRSRAAAASENARRLYERQAELVKINGVSRQNFENAESAWEQAQEQLKEAEASVRLVEAGFRPEETAAAEAGVKAATAAVEAAGANHAAAVAAVRTAEIQLADTEMKSPSDGVVITRALEPGAIVAPGPTVISLSLEDPVWVRAYVPEPELGTYPPGTKVSLFTDSNPGHAYQGTVGFVSPRAEFTPKSVETEELRTSLVYRLRVVVSDSDGSLRQGMPVTVKLDH